MKIQTDIGDFVISLFAELSVLDIVVPEYIEFSFCPIGMKTSQAFSVNNRSIFSITITWQIMQPFAIEPSSSQIPPMQTLQFTCRLHPKIAAVYRADARCTISGPNLNSEKRLVHVSAISKYSHIKIDRKDIDFGETSLDHPQTQLVHVENVGDVPAYVFWRSLTETNFSNAFVVKLSTNDVKIGLGSSLDIPIEHRAFQAGHTSIHQLEIGCRGGNSTQVTCRGKGLGPVLRLDKDYIQFKERLAGSCAQQSVKLFNESKQVAVYYQIRGGNGVFQLSSRCGHILPGSSASIQVKFRPMKPCQYYERLEILINYGCPLFLHVIASCFSRGIHPAQIRMEQLFEQTTSNPIMESAAHSQYRSIPSKIITNQCPEILRFHSYFDNVSSKDIQILECPSGVQFGSTPVAGQGSIQKVHLRNLTGSKICVLWHHDMDGRDKSRFSIRPEQLEIAAHETAECEVEFQPLHIHEYYQRQFSATVYRKNSSSSTGSNHNRIDLPSNLALDVYGHTFPQNSEHFFPIGGFYPAHAQFRPVRLGGESYSTVRLVNSGNIPFHFRFFKQSVSSDHEACLQIHPEHGHVQPRSFLIITLRFSPSKLGLMEHNLSFTVNYSYIWTLPVSGSAEDIQVECYPNHTLYFSGSCPGALSTRSQKISNRSSVPALFSITLDEGLNDILTVNPDHGNLTGHESLEITWSLRHHNQGRISAPAQCEIFSDDPEPYLCMTLPLQIKAGIADLSATLTVLDCGSRISTVGVPNIHQMCLTNTSDCDLVYNLNCKMIADLPFDFDLNLDHKSGTLSGYGSVVVDVHLTLWGRGPYCIQASCAIPSGLPHSEMIIICDANITGESVLPRLQIVDIFSDDLPLSSVFQMFRPDLINKQLEGDLNKFECDLQRYGPSPELSWTPDFMSQHIPTYTCRLMPRLLGHPNTCAIIRLHNPGPVSLQLEIRGPASYDLDHELWVDPEQRSTQEQRHIDILKSGFAQYEPERAHIAAGEYVDLVLRFSHNQAQTIQLPLIFDILLGKKFILNIEMETILHNARSIIILESFHELQPVPIGLQDWHVPFQYLRLHNPCSVPIEFQVGDDGFNDVNNAAAGYPVLQCLTKQGTIQANDIADIKIKFRPLQATRYRSKLVVGVANGSKSEIEILGQGYMPAASLPLFDACSLRGQIIPRDRLATLYPFLIDLGSAAAQSTSEHIAFIENISTDTICFEFCNDCSFPDDDFSIQISPRKYVLNPGQRIIVRVIISAGCVEQYLSRLIRVCVCRIGEHSDHQGQNLLQTNNIGEGLAYRSTIRNRLTSKTILKPIDSCREWRMNNQIQKPIVSSSLWLEVKGTVCSPTASVIPRYHTAEQPIMTSDEARSRLQTTVKEMILKSSFDCPKSDSHLIPFFVHVPNCPVLPHCSDMVNNIEQYVGEKLSPNLVRTILPPSPSNLSIKARMHISDFYHFSEHFINEIIQDLIEDIDNNTFGFNVLPKQVVVKGLSFK